MGNALICSRNGLGVTAFTGRDHDGDEVFVAAHDGLLEFTPLRSGQASE